MASRILVIDDSLTVRKLVELSLKEGYALEFAATGTEGVAKAIARPPDCILLDYVLPDMKGTDVCRELSGNPRTSVVPVIIMSGRSDTVRALFKDFRAVSEIIVKPFAQETLLQTLGGVLHGVKLAQASGSSGEDMTSSQVIMAEDPGITGRKAGSSVRESIARAIYLRLRDQLAQIPSWAQQVGKVSPAPYFAKKLLTSDTVDALLDVLSPFAREAQAGGDGGSFEGDLGVLSLGDVLRTIAATHRTGELALGQGKQRTVVYLRHGEPMLISGFDPAAWASELGFDLTGIAEAARQRAEEQQRGTGKPLVITLHEENLLPPCDVTELVAAQGRKLLAAVPQNAGQFGFAPRTLPSWVETYGRPIGAAQLTLDRLRREVDWGALAQAIPALDLVLERAGSFSRRIRDVDLEANERRLLTLVDGRSTVTDLQERAALPLAETLRLLYRLGEAGLIRRRGSVAVVQAGGQEGPRPVLILEPDEEGFERPLGALLSSRPERRQLVSLRGEADVLSAIMRERPTLVLINCTVFGAEAERTARAVAGTAEFSDLRLAAVLEHGAPDQEQELLAAGFDAVLVKPVHFGSVEQLLRT